MAVIWLSSCAWGSYRNEGKYGYDDDQAYIIDSVADFIELPYRVNSGLKSAGVYYKLDLCSKTINLATSEYSELAPIGIEQNPFRGHLNGSGYTINVDMNKALEEWKSPQFNKF